MSYLEEHRNEIFKKYSDEELIKDCNNFVNGGGRLTKFLNHFFEELIFESCGKKTKISPMECLQNDEMMNKILNYILSKPKFFKSEDEVANVKSCLRNSMSWVRKVANFPPKEARDIYLRYFDSVSKPLNCLDTSSGFGSRMSAVLLSGNNYYSTDPNPKLHDKLFECAKWLYNNGFIKENQHCELIRQGSEVFVQEWENMMDVSFTSPPYFNLEKYCDDDSASTQNYNNYALWVENFVIPTVQNTYKYLKIGGYAMINIKNINTKETCYNDFYKAFNEIKGFQYVETFDLNISKKQYGMMYNNEKGVIVPKEPVMVFRKVF